MKDPQKTMANVNQMTWPQLEELMSQELNTIPVQYHVVFEYVFRKPWPKFVEFIMHLSKKDFSTISSVHNQLLMLGDLTESEITELVLIGSFNSWENKSPKVEFYLISRLFHRRPRKRSILTNIRVAIDNI